MVGGYGRVRSQARGECDSGGAVGVPFGPIVPLVLSTNNIVQTDGRPARRTLGREDARSRAEACRPMRQADWRVIRTGNAAFIGVRCDHRSYPGVDLSLPRKVTAQKCRDRRCRPAPRACANRPPTISPYQTSSDDRFQVPLPPTRRSWIQTRSHHQIIEPRAGMTILRSLTF
jgi:hypothetical protein